MISGPASMTLGRFVSRLGGTTVLGALLVGLCGPASAGAVNQPSPAQAGSAAAGQVGSPAGGQSGSAAADRATLRELADSNGIYVGAAVRPGPLADEEPYRATLAREFNAVTPENALKWAEVEPQRGQYDWAAADQITEFAEANGQQVRGHTLVWHNQLPSWLTNGDFTADELRTILREHIMTEVNRYEDRIFAWDVVNEPFNEDGTLRDTMWLRELGPDYIADALRWAHQANPDAKLYLNEYNIMGINAKSDAMYDLVRSLKQQGVPIHGVGIEGHRTLGQIPGSTQENIERFAALGVDVAVTELDVRIQLPASEQELRTQAEDYRQVMEACLAVSRCVGVTTWGFSDKYSWIPGWFEGQGAALPFDENYEPKPAYYAMRVALGGEGPPDDGDGEEPPGSGSCSVAYQVQNQWGTGFTGQIEITNNGSPTDGWSLEFDFTADQQLTDGWKGNWSQSSGSHVTVTSKSWNAEIGTGESITVGFNASHSGTNPEPTSFSLNGTNCNVV